MPKVQVHKITLEEGSFGSYRVVCDDGRDVLVQTDWDFPGLARTFGHILHPRRLPNVNGERVYCHHDHTDGTIDCNVCGKMVSDFISEAQQYLDAHIGATADDPGYFDEEN